MRRFAFEQEAPERQLQTYSNLVTSGGLLPGTTTTTGPGTQGAGAAAGALGGAGLGSLIPFAPAAGTLFGGAGAAGSGVQAGALAGINPYILGGAILGGLLS